MELDALPPWPEPPFWSDQQRQYEEAYVHALRARLELAVDALQEAHEDIAHWAGYASEYFQKKHDLDGTLAKHKRTIEACREPS